MTEVDAGGDGRQEPRELTSHPLLQSVLEEHQWAIPHLEKLREKSEWNYKASERVGLIADALGKALGLPEHEQFLLVSVAFFHDIGKGHEEISETTLNKPGPLTSEEEKEINEHARLGFNIIQAAGAMDIARRMVGHHEHQKRPYPREKVRGPRNEEEEKILRDQQLIALADMFDTVMSERPYTVAQGIEPMTAEQAEAEALKQFIEDKKDKDDEVATPEATPKIPEVITPKLIKVAKETSKSLPRPKLKL